MSASLLQRERTTLVVVDLQEKLLPAIQESERVLQNSLLLLRLAQVIGLPVVLTTQYRKGLGETVPDVLSAAPGVEPIDKLAFGCFGSDAFLERIDSFAGRDQLVVAGIESHICVAQTVLGALNKGYAVHVASDAVGSRAESNRQVGLRRMERAGAVLSSAEMAVYETAGTQRRRGLQADAAVPEGLGACPGNDGRHAPNGKTIAIRSAWLLPDRERD